MNNQLRIPRNTEGHLIANCKITKGVSIGSFDCTANCPHNENTKKEIQEQAFDLEFVKCSKIINQDQLQMQL
jgi:hypothetical protein